METESGAEYISPTHVRHIMRYVRACQFLKPGMKVLDAACGTGYGTAIISKTNRVMGLDLNREAIEEAKRNYPKLDFVYTDLLHPSTTLDRIVEAVISLETIEHFSKNDIPRYLKTIKTALRERGLFVVSTPYCIESGPSPITKQHLNEFSLTDLEIELTEAGFDVQGIYPERHEGQAGRLGYCMVHSIAR